jgi:hypothetical protein
MIIVDLFLLDSMRPGLKVIFDTGLSHSIDMYRVLDVVSSKMKLAKVSAV